MSRNIYAKTISTLTSAGSTSIPEGVKMVKITNNDSTNFVTLSFENAIGSSGNNEVILAAGDSIDFANVGRPVFADTLYHQADTAGVNISVIGYIV